MSDQPVLTAVIPAHNGAATIVAQLDAVAVAMKAAPPVEVIVVNNRSTDDTADVVDQWAQANEIDVRIVSATDGASVAYARNVGIAEASADRVCFCDSDDIISPEWLVTMAEALGEHPVVTGPLDLDSLNPTWLAEVRGRNAIDKQAFLFDRIAYAHGCNLGIRREVVETIGNFDEGLKSGEDLEFAVRLDRAGIPIHFAREAVVSYRLRSGLRDTVRQARSYGKANAEVRRLVEADPTIGSPWPAMGRRLLWVLRTAPRAAFDRPRRWRLLWVATHLFGECEGRLASRGRPS